MVSVSQGPFDARDDDDADVHAATCQHDGRGHVFAGIVFVVPTSLVIALASSSSEDVLNDRINDIVERGYTSRRTSSGGGGGDGDASGVV